MFKFITRLFKKKKKVVIPEHKTIEPKGVAHTIVPKEYQEREWDEHLFKTKIYL